MSTRPSVAIKALGAPDWYCEHVRGYEGVLRDPFYYIIDIVKPLVLDWGHLKATNKRLADQCLQMDRNNTALRDQLVKQVAHIGKLQGDLTEKNRHILELTTRVARLMGAAAHREARDLVDRWGVKSLDLPSLRTWAAKQAGTSAQVPVRPLADLPPELHPFRVPGERPPVDWEAKFNEGFRDNVALCKKLQTAKDLVASQEAQITQLRAENAELLKGSEVQTQALKRMHGLETALYSAKCRAEFAETLQKSTERKAGDLWNVSKEVPELHQLVELQAKKIEELHVAKGHEAEAAKKWHDKYLQAQEDIKGFSGQREVYRPVDKAQEIFLYAPAALNQVIAHVGGPSTISQLIYDAKGLLTHIASVRTIGQTATTYSWGHQRGEYPAVFAPNSVVLRAVEAK